MRRIKEGSQTLLQIQAIKLNHPLWGYRRIWAYMRYRLNQTVNRKRIRRIMKEHNLLVSLNLRLKARRGNQSNKNRPKATRANQFWGTDMAKALIPSFGWLYLAIALDWFTKKIVGYSVSGHSRAEDWPDALSSACNSQFPSGVLSKQDELYIISDNGSQPTSKKYMQACSVMEIKQILASCNNPKGNAGTERVMRAIKEDFIWVRELSSRGEFTEAFRKWVEDCNNDYPHSSLNYLTPRQFEKEQLLLTTKI